MFIGLLMICGEDDVLEETLAHNSRYLDCFYVLDGTQPNDVSGRVCRSHPKCWGYRQDKDLPLAVYGSKPRDGWRQSMLEDAVTDHGHGHWYLILHGDEVWTRHPRHVVDERHDGFVYRLPMYFPRAGEEWDYSRSALEQLRWHLAPGWPEFRLFRGAPHVHYLPEQHFNTKPEGIASVWTADDPIKHYLYRSPEAQRARAKQHQQTQFDPDNYQHITDGDEVYWTNAMIAKQQLSECFSELREEVPRGSLAGRV